MIKNKEVEVNLKALKKLDMSSWAERAGKELKDLSNAQAPDDTGELIDSSEVIVDGEQAKVVYKAPYASYQHEGMRKDGTREIKNRPAGGKSKFLEDPWRNNEKRWVKFAKQEARKKIKSIL